ncbi:lysozyme inhibitor LprI family protein [Martelella soudanensis]|uniref:lysozyme inhibitor LprI family protein n=1 Tax=unclassified Martelella TaxID=2629616 RepID=UPI0015E054D6|nr:MULTISPECIES: lysozyme inhibitor LprI family protein [unclassified Martelella]
MTVFRLGLAAALMVAGPVFAQDEQVRYSDAPIANCLAAAETPEAMRACVGLAAAQCVDASDYGSTTIGMMECAEKETAFWDGRLNETYKAMMARAKKADAMNEGDPRIVEKIADSLRDMQRAWIPYRDATCTFAYSTGMGGTIAQTITSNCQLDMTAEQYIYLEGAWPSY